MNKQLLLLISSFLITASSHCSEKPKPAWQIAHLIGNALENQKSCPPAETDETLASFFQRAPKRTAEQEKASKNECDLDPSLILIPFNTEAKTLTENMNACAVGLDQAAQQFSQRHSIFEEQVNKVYAHYLAEKKKATFCVASPSYHTLVLRTQRMTEHIRDLPIKDEVYSSNKITFKETVVGLLQSLLETKERVKKN